MWALTIFFCFGVIMGACVAVIFLWFLIEAKHQQGDSRINVPPQPKFYSTMGIAARPKFLVLNGGKIRASISEAFRLVSPSHN
jgi:hypothetical protein